MCKIDEKPDGQTVGDDALPGAQVQAPTTIPIHEQTGWWVVAQDGEIHPSLAFGA